MTAGISPDQMEGIRHYSDKLGLDKIIQGPDEVLKGEDYVFARTQYFYDLRFGMTSESQDLHQEVALEFGRMKDALFIKDVILPRLVAGEKITLQNIDLLRASIWENDDNPKTNLFKLLEDEFPDQFQAYWIPIGVTRHESVNDQIRFKLYAPSKQSDLSELINRNDETSVIVRVKDFGGASGESAEQAVRMLGKASWGGSEVFIDTTIATDEALKKYQRVVSPANTRRMLKGYTAPPQFWITAFSTENGPRFDITAAGGAKGIQGKDWGWCLSGQEDNRLFLQEIYPGTSELYDNQKFFLQYMQDQRRLREKITRVLALNSDTGIQSLYNERYLMEMTEWYAKRFLSLD